MFFLTTGTEENSFSTITDHGAASSNSSFLHVTQNHTELHQSSYTQESSNIIPTTTTRGEAEVDPNVDLNVENLNLYYNNQVQDLHLDYQPTTATVTVDYQTGSSEEDNYYSVSMGNKQLFTSSQSHIQQVGQTELNKRVFFKSVFW